MAGWTTVTENTQPAPPSGWTPVKPTYDPLAGAAQATGMGADTRGPFRRAWDEISRGLTSAQAGEGLKPQPTVLANAAQGLGMIGDTVARLGVGPEMAAGAAAAEAAVPSAERAGKAFQVLRGTIGEHTVHMTDNLAGTLADIKDAVDTGSTLPSVINKFVTRIADVDEGPLTYKEARQFYHNVSELSASEKMAAKGSDLRLINNFKHALGDTIANTAASAGRLEQYQGAMKEFSTAQGLKEGAKTAIKVGIGLGGLGSVGGGIYRAYGALRDLAGR